MTNPKTSPDAVATAPGAAAPESSGPATADSNPQDFTVIELLQRLMSRIEGMESRIEGMESRVVSRMNQIDAQQLETNKKIEFMTGNYYAPLDSIWNKKKEKFDGAAVTWEKHRKKDFGALKAYQIEDPRLKYSEEDYPKAPLFPGNLSRAHGIPNDPTCSFTWGPVLKIVTGWGNNESSNDMLESSNNMLENKQLRIFVEGRNPDLAGEDEKPTPLKALSWNFLKLPENHEKHFDRVSKSSENGLILAPIWNPEKEWAPGTPYCLLVAGKPETYKWLMGTDVPSENAPQMKWLKEVSSDDDIDMATEFLALTVKALADLLVKNDDLLGIAERLGVEGTGKTSSVPVNELEKAFYDVENGVDPADLFTVSESLKSAGSKSNKSRFRERVETFKRKARILTNNRKRISETLKGKVLIPVKKVSVRDKKILKIDLGVYFQSKEHLIPDPYLWVLKAGSSWGGYTSEKTLLACDVDDPVDSDVNIPLEISVVGGRGGDEDSSVSCASMCMTYEFSAACGELRVVTP